MSDTFWIIAEIIVGIAILGLLSAAITLVMTRLLTKGPPAAAILDERYSRDQLTRAQYLQMREDLGIGVITTEGRPSSPLDGRDAGGVSASRQTK